MEGGFRVHIVSQGEELDEIAYRYSGTTRLWWLIADINGLASPFNLAVGQKLLIPQVAEFAKR
jgi:nucleoid-associated protein YgaU